MTCPLKPLKALFLAETVKEDLQENALKVVAEAFDQPESGCDIFFLIHGESFRLGFELIDSVASRVSFIEPTYKYLYVMS